jgi:RNA-binding protein PNO1
MRKVHVPAHRFTPLRDSWLKIYEPLVEHLKLQVRMNTRSRNVEIRVSVHCAVNHKHVYARIGRDTEREQTSEFTVDIGALQKAEDFVRAFILGFSIDDAIALVRLEDLFVETFEVEDGFVSFVSFRFVCWFIHWLACSFAVRWFVADGCSEVA